MGLAVEVVLHWLIQIQLSTAAVLPVDMAQDAEATVRRTDRIHTPPTHPTAW
jgi:hypothetical protein